MASWQTHITNFILRRTVKAKVLRSPDPITLRGALGKMRFPIREGNSTARTLLYIHGGAHIACSPQTHRPIASAFAAHGWRVFSPDYRLAPEYAFPAGLNDVIACYRALLSNADATRIVIAGDSAGGNLALALCLSIRDSGEPLPAALALFSPVTDFAWTGESVQSNSKSCALLAAEILPFGTRYYLGEHDPLDPLASPLYGNLHGLPPMVIHASQHEVLRDDSVRLAQRAQQAGVTVQWQLWPHVPHVWQMAHRFIPEGRESLRLATDFLDRYVPRN